jgi:hypothetical protein
MAGATSDSGRSPATVFGRWAPCPAIGSSVGIHVRRQLRSLGSMSGERSGGRALRRRTACSAVVHRRVAQSAVWNLFLYAVCAPCRSAWPGPARRTRQLTIGAAGLRRGFAISSRRDPELGLSPRRRPRPPHHNPRSAHRSPNSLGRSARMIVVGSARPGQPRVMSATTPGFTSWIASPHTPPGRPPTRRIPSSSPHTL